MGLGDRSASAVNTTTLLRAGDIVTGQIVSVPPIPSEGPGGAQINYAVISYRWDCAGKTEQIIKLAAYGEDGGVLGEQSLDGPGRPIVEGTTAGVVWAVAWGVQQADKSWPSVAEFAAEYRARLEGARPEHGAFELKVDFAESALGAEGSGQGGRSTSLYDSSETFRMSAFR